MLQISAKRLEETISLFTIAVILTVILFINDVVLYKPSQPPAHQVKTILVEEPKPAPIVVAEKPKPKTDVECLASVIYHEARGESVDGQIAVGNVVLNRVKSRHYPRSVCGVAFQPKQFTGLTRVKYNKSAMKLAKKIMVGAVDYVTEATHFHTVHVNPKWASNPRMVYLGTIGDHVFYKMS